MTQPLTQARVIGANINALSWQEALDTLSNWAIAGDSRYVCICNVHSVVTAYIDPTFAQVINSADMATPDGAPVAWMLRQLGFQGQQRINGPDLMWKYCDLAQSTEQSIYLYGGMPETLEILQQKLASAFPKLKIAGSYAPPFRALTPEEDHAIIDKINQSGASTVWVSLGCPKQENWMQSKKGRVNSVMIGVGAAFDYHAQTIKRAPQWMQAAGLEWFHRLSSEPRRLWRRYLLTNSLFILLAIRQLLCHFMKGRKA